MDLNALANPRRSIRIIIIDCITENGPVLGALWIFSTDSKSQKGVKQDISFEETAVTTEKAKEVGNTAAAEQVSRFNNEPSASTTHSLMRKCKDKPLSTPENVKEVKQDEILKKLSVDNVTDAIIEEFDYHHSMNAGNYEKYFEKICTLLKPNSLIVNDNASYHSRNSEAFPVSEWRKAQFQQWLMENKINF